MHLSNQSFFTPTMRRSSAVAAALLSFGLAGVTNAATIEGYNFFGILSSATPATYNATTTAANTDVAGVLSRGSGAAASGAANSFRTTGFKNDGIALTNTDYFQFSASASDGNTLSLSSISNTFAGTSSYFPATYQYAYSIDNGAYTLIGTAQSLSTTPASSSVTLSGIAALQNIAAASTVNFRLYASGATATGGFGYTSSSAAVANDGLDLNGTVNSLSAPPNDTTVTAASPTVTTGRTLVGQTIGVGYNVSGAQGTTVTTASVGGLSAGSSTAAAGATSGTVALVTNNAQLGTQTDSVVLHNAASTSAGANQGSADPDDTVAVTSTIVQNRQIGDTATGGTSVLALGKVLVGATATGSATVHTVGSDDTATEVTLKGGLSGSYTNTTTTGGVTTTNYTVSVATGPNDTFFNSAGVTAGVTGSGNFAAAGAKSGIYLSLGGATADVKNSLVGEGLAGENDSGRVYITASAYSASNGSFDSATADNNSKVINFGTFNQGDAAGTSAYSIYNLLGTNLANYTAGLDLVGVMLVSGDGTPFTLGVSNGHLVVDGSTAANNFLAATAGFSTANAGVFDATYSLILADASDITGGTSNQTPLTLELTGTVLPVGIPEPASLALLGLGSLGMLTRRRRMLKA